MCRSYGPPEVVQVESVPTPPLDAGQARVRVAAASINYPDVLIVAGTYQIKVPPPFVPGSEFAGVVTDVAADVTEVSIDDRVSGTGMVGAFAEEAVVAATSLAKVPDGLDLKTASAFGVAHRTSYHVLRSVADLQPGEELVVIGAGGGVGLAAVQLGAVLGASVTAVASSEEKLASAIDHGATHTINHRERDLRETLRELHPDGVDVVVDPVGGALAEPALRALRWKGRFVTVGYASGDIPRIPLNLVLLKGIHILGFEFITFASRAAEEFVRNESELAKLVSCGQAVPHIGATFDLDEAAAALRHVADGNAVGKVVLSVNPDID